MDTIKSYKELCNDINFWKARLKSYEIQLETIKKEAKLYGPGDIKAIDYSEPSVQETPQISFEAALKQMKKIESHILLHQNTIERLEKLKKEIEDNIKELEGIDKKVVYMRDIEGKKLVDIAEELGYSYDYIREISSKNKRPTVSPQTKEK